MRIQTSHIYKVSSVKGIETATKIQQSLDTVMCAPVPEAGFELTNDVEKKFETTVAGR